MDDWQHGGFGVYIHWPFCLSKCPYCDFNSHVRQSVDQDIWREALLSELRNTAALTGPRVVNTVFFGGGTPSLMPEKTVAAIIQEIDKVWGFANSVEITLEANPTSVEAGKFQGFARAGVNRISMGIQALNDEDLRRLGRLHNVAEGMQAFDIAKDSFDRVSFDLIYARQNQTLEQWQTELQRALDLSVDHLSLYQLTIEANTRFGDLYKAGKLRDLPSDDEATDMYLATQETCSAAGMDRYEVSNHSKNGAQSQHNLVYWRYGDYAGIGPGAHGRLTINSERFATSTRSNPENWLVAVLDNGHGRNEFSKLSIKDQTTEYMLMATRLAEGVDLTRLNRSFGFEIEAAKLRELSEMGLIKIDHSHLSTTNKGTPLLNAILREVL